MWTKEHPNWCLKRITSNLPFSSLPPFYWSLWIMNVTYLFINIAQCAFKYTFLTLKAMSAVICSSFQLQWRNISPPFKGQDLHMGYGCQTLQSFRTSINKPLFLQGHQSLAFLHHHSNMTWYLSPGGLRKPGPHGTFQLLASPSRTLDGQESQG